jgi:hypothetical protein
MKKNSLFVQSRRGFIQTVSLASLGALASPSKLFGQSIKKSNPTSADVTIDLIRSRDKLHLRFSFYNAIYDGRFINKLDQQSTSKIFVLVTLPPQHIAESLVKNINDLSTQKSKLSQSSELALILNGDRIKIDESNLLDWNNNFSVVSIDDFLKVQNDSINNQEGIIKGDVPTVLRHIKDNRKLISKSKFLQNLNDNNNYWPITKFEIPYKMFLSPIGEVLDERSPKGYRQIGNYEFDSNKVGNLYEFKNGGKLFQIEKLWENELNFKSISGESFAPRFKVINYSTEDCDENFDYLPAPIHRQELYHLTMLAPGDRDVVSKYFKVSALGGLAHLKYKNGLPIKGTAIVGWEQNIKYARDNEVSITYRAIDIITTLKVLVSVKSERKYSNGKSYLLKRYYLEYLEKEKVYDSPLNVGSMVFSKIVPLSGGQYFFPDSANGSSASYHILEECEDQANCKWDRLNSLSFEYLGYDKSGKPHKFSIKMVIIMAESYVITCGKFEVFKSNGELEKSYTATSDSVDIRHIGFLNDRNNVSFESNSNHDEIEKCDNQVDELDCNGKVYEFKLVRNFNDRKRLNLNLEKVAQDLDLSGVIYDYSFKINNEFTFADIKSVGYKGLYISNDKEVLSSSSNTSFETKKIFIFSKSNDTLYDSDNDIGIIEDVFQDKFPLIPYLHHAEVKINQIDQIDGSSQFRKVGLANSFYDQNRARNLAFEKEVNPARLLFKLIDNGEVLYGGVNNYITPIDQIESPISNFFTKNYKKAGGMVNPGIVISHISALDQGITYNETHNKVFKTAQEKMGSPRLNIKTSSIFSGLDAEICGIPILSIIEDSIPVGEIPEFNFIKDAQETYNKVENFLDEADEIFKEKKNQYDNLVKTLSRAKSTFEKLDEKLLEFGKSKFRNWMDAIVDQFQILELLDKQKSFVRKNEEKIKGYVKDLEGIEQAIYKAKVVKANDIKSHKAKIEKIVNLFNKDTDNLQNNYDELKEVFKISKLTKNELKEVVKILVLRELIINSKNIDYLFEFLIEYERLIDLLERENKNYFENYIAVKDALYEAAEFSCVYLKKKIDRLQLQAENKLKELQEEYSSNLVVFLNGFQNEFRNWIHPIETLYNTYNHYSVIYGQFKLGNYSYLIDDLDRNYGVKVCQNPNDCIDQKVFEIEKELTNELKKEVSEVEIYVKNQIIVQDINNLKKKIENEVLIGEAVLNDQKERIQNYQKIIESGIDEIQTKTAVWLSYANLIDSEVEKIKTEYLLIQQEIKEKEREVKNFGRNIIQTLDDKIEQERKKLQNTLLARNEYKTAVEIIRKVEALKTKLQEASKQQLSYQYSTTKFKKASLGVIDFKPQKTTKLQVDVKYNIEFDISKFDAAPAIKKQSYSTLSTLKDFNISFLRLITIDFEKVAFVSGSDVKDDFQVAIRNIEFEGVLSFVQAFQEYMKNIDNNLIFNVNATGASIGYSLPIPDIQTGAFNFFNLNLSALLTLPFDPKKSLQLKFGLGSPYSKFGMTYTTFGGQGYFNIIVEPKRGVVGLEVVLEFGAIFNLNLGVAKGTAYLVGGIFIRRYNKEHEIRGYILCVGRFNVIGMFSASISFYLGLEGDGNSMYGTCVVTVSKRFSRFFKVSVSCRMSKRISGSKSSKNKQLRAKLVAEELGLEFIEGNLNTYSNINLSGKNRLYIRFLAVDQDKNDYFLRFVNSLDPSDIIEFKKIVFENKGCRGRILSYELVSNNFPRNNGVYNIQFGSSTDNGITINFKKLDTVSVSRNNNILGNSGISDCHLKELYNDREYFSSYF